MLDWFPAAPLQLLLRGYSEYNHRLPSAQEVQDSCDVCIVGAGFTGISAALHLAERGYKVSVLEANRVSWGASGRNGGQLIGGISGEERLKKTRDKDISDLIWKMRWAGHEIIRQCVEKYAIDCDLKFGYMDVAIKPRHWRDLLEEYESLQRPDFPYETRLVPKQEITERYRYGCLYRRLDQHGQRPPAPPEPVPG